MIEHDKAVEPKAGERRVFRGGGVDFAMRWIPAGRFWMGTGKKEQHYLEHEGPQHEVTITRGFWMGETLVECVTTQLYGDDNVAWSWDNSNKMTHSVGQNGEVGSLSEVDASPEHSGASSERTDVPLF